MKEFIKKYFSRHFPIGKLFAATTQKEAALDFNSFTLSRGRQIWLKILSISHWVCLAGFLIAILVANVPAWKITNWHVPFTTREFNPIDLLKTLCVSGLIGFGTNYIAIQMLFRPVQKRPIWGQGLIPSQRDRIVYTLASGMHKYILAEELIMMNLDKAGLPQKISDFVIDSTNSLIKDEELKEEIREWIVAGMKEYFEQEHIRKDILAVIDAKVDTSLEGGVKKFLVNTYRNYQREDYHTFINKMIDEVPPTAGMVMDKFGDEKTDEIILYLNERRGELSKLISFSIAELLSRLDIPDLLRTQMAHFDDSRLERMVREATNEQLLYIQYLGTILGLLGGMLIWEPVFMLVVYGLLIGFLFALDIFLFNRGNSAK